MATPAAPTTEAIPETSPVPARFRVRLPAAPGRSGVGWVMAVLGMLVAIVLSLDFVFRLHIAFGLFGDGISRVANASYVLFTRNPHLAAIGFVWNPLPSLVEMPILLFKWLFPPLLTYGYAGNILSIVTFGLTLGVMDRTLRRFRIPAPWRVAWLLAYALNPLILEYAANGMTESFFIMTIAFTIDSLVNYLQTEHYAPLGQAGMWLAAGFLVRYEAVFVGAAVALIVAWAHLWRKRTQVQLEGSLFYVLLAPVYIGILWLVANWLIMGNPLYFLNSQYSNSAQTAVSMVAGSGYLASGEHSLTHAAFFVFSHLLLYVAWIPLALFAFLPRRGLIPKAMVLIPLSIYILQFLLVFRGQSAGWTRFYIYVIPGAIWLSGALFEKSRQHLLYALVSLLLLASSAVTGWAVLQTRYPWIGRGETAPFEDTIDQRTGTQYKFDRSITGYLDALPLPHGPILTDVFTNYAIVIDSRRMTRFAVTSDQDFQSLVSAPWGRISYFLVSVPTGAGRLDAVNVAYPNLYHHGASWATLVKSWPGKRLFRIAPTPGPT